MFNILRFLQDINKDDMYCPYNGQIRTICPVHHGSTASFCYYLEDDGFYCFRCHIHGAGIASLLFLLDYSEEEILDAYAEYTMDENDAEEDRPQVGAEKELSYTKEMVKIREWYSNGFGNMNIATNWFRIESAEQHYLFARGILPGTLNHFKVALFNDLPEHKIYIPLALNGEVMGYQRRGTSDGKYRTKYITQAGMQKTMSVYGHLEGDTALVTEGVTDMWVAWQRGVESTVTTLGAIISEVQMRQMADHGIKYLVLAMHHDQAGDEAYLDAKLKADHYGIVVTRLDLSKDIADSRKDDFLASYARANEFLESQKYWSKSVCQIA